MPGIIAMAWAWCFKSLLTADHKNLCDLTRFVHAQHVLMLYQAKNDTGDLRALWPTLRGWATHAYAKLNRLIGPESVLGAESLYMLIWDGPRISPAIKDEQLESILSSPITSGNFYFKIKLIDGWQYSMASRGMLAETESIILAQLDRFLNCGTSLRTSWTFGLDPVLDLHEYAIHLYKVWIPNPEKVSDYQARYLSYFEQEYGTLEERLCLGCGVGVFGLRHARFRAQTGLKRAQDPGVYALEMEVFRRLREKLGEAGSCLPNGDENTTRLAEQQWCFARHQGYIQARHGPRPSNASSFGAASWNSVAFPREDTEDTALYQAEAARVRTLVKEVFDEINSLGSLGGRGEAEADS